MSSLIGNSGTGTQGPTGPVGPAGPLEVQPSSLSWVDVASFVGVNSSTLAPGYTTGARYYTFSDRTILGARFYYKRVAATDNVRLSLWDASGTRITYVDVSITTDGIHSAVFDTPQSISKYTKFTTTAWNTAGAGHSWFALGNFTRVRLPATAHNVSMIMGPYLVCMDTGIYAAGDAFPDSQADQSSAIYPVEPILDVS